MDPETSPITRVLHRVRDGDDAARAQLVDLVYAQLHALARARMASEPAGHTLQPTALVHEAFLRLGDPSAFACRAHFFASAAEAMRRILVDAARSRARRGPRAEGEPELAFLPPDERVLDVEAALLQLEQRDPRKGQVVKLRYFAGLSVDEVAEVLGVSIGTVERDWRLARAILQREIGD